MFNQESKEYRENGFYIIDDVQFYSIWTFKKKFELSNNNNNQNKIDATNINGPSYLSKPDFGNFSSVKLFSINELKSYYLKK